MVSVFPTFLMMYPKSHLLSLRQIWPLSQYMEQILIQTSEICRRTYIKLGRPQQQIGQMQLTHLRDSLKPFRRPLSVAEAARLHPGLLPTVYRRARMPTSVR
jgi:hypothetical protein